jgi:glutamyl-tRNA(Gln) amidotransferase subunit D
MQKKMVLMEAKSFLAKHGLKEGNLVEAVFQGETFLGTIVPSKENGMLFLKLKSGYNVGLEEKKIFMIKKISEGQKVAKPGTIEIKQNPSLPKILILHTGGTIASRVNYETGGVFASFSPSDLLAMFPELMQKANFETKLIANIESENMRFVHYAKIAEEIKKTLGSKPMGIIIPHGTDTMAYTAAALAFMIQSPQIPILLVGAQRSSDRGSSDAAMNLSCAVDFITKTNFCGIGICMHENENDSACVILPPTKTRKMHSSRRDAFKAINAKPIARIEYKTGKIEFLEQNYLKKGHELQTVFKTKMEEKTGLLKSTPALIPEQITFFAKQKFQGLVLEGTGLGHLPILSRTGIEKTNAQNFKALQSLIKKGCIVVMTTQCIYGRVDMNVYSAGRELLKIGVLEGKDMLPETALVKLAWLLGNFSKKQVPELFSKNLCGEINERTPLDSKAPDL